MLFKMDNKHFHNDEKNRRYDQCNPKIRFKWSIKSRELEPWLELFFYRQNREQKRITQSEVTLKNFHLPVMVDIFRSNLNSARGKRG